jgi:hypothetical protein
MDCFFNRSLWWGHFPVWRRNRTFVCFSIVYQKVRAAVK